MPGSVTACRRIQPSRVPRALGEAEVEDLHAAHRRDEQVLGLEVAVDDALAMGGREAVRRLDRDSEQSVAEWAGGGKQLPQGLALEQLGHDKRCAALGADVVDRQDVRMIERGDGPGFLLEATEPVGVSGNLVGKDFDGNVAVEAAVASLVDLAHAAGPDGCEDLIRPEASAGQEGHEKTGGIVAPILLR